MVICCGDFVNRLVVVPTVRVQIYACSPKQSYDLVLLASTIYALAHHAIPRDHTEYMIYERMDIETDCENGRIHYYNTDRR